MNSSIRQHLSTHQEHLLFEALPKILFASKFFIYHQLSSVECPLDSFLSVPEERFWVFARELFGAVPCGTYFLGGLVLVRLAVLSGAVPAVPV